MIKNKINGKMYIGQTMWYRKRKNMHFNELINNKHPNQHLQNSFNKYGIENFTIEILEEVPVEELDNREIYWINYYDTINNGYNIESGGKSARGHKRSKEVKQKMRENHADVSGKNNPMYGKTLYDFLTDKEIIQWKEKIGASSKGNKNCLGYKHTFEARMNMSNAYLKSIKEGRRKPFIFTKEHLKKAHEVFRLKYSGENNPNARKVICLNNMEVFNCIEYACKKYGISSSSIVSCCTGKLCTCTSNTKEQLVWMYYEDYIQQADILDVEKYVIEKQLKSKMFGKYNPNAIQVICINTGEVFDSAMDAARFYSIDNSSINKCCKGIIKSCGKHPVTGEKLIWVYGDK